MVEVPPAERKMIAYESGRIVIPDTTGVSLVNDRGVDMVALLHIAGHRVDDTYLDEVIAIHAAGAIGLIAQLRAAVLGHYPPDVIDMLVEKAIEALHHGQESE